MDRDAPMGRHLNFKKKEAFTNPHVWDLPARLRQSLIEPRNIKAPLFPGCVGDSGAQHQFSISS